MTDDRSLALPTVQRVFADSERALTDLQERLRSIMLAEETATSSAASLAEVARSVGAMAAGMHESLGALDRVQAQLAASCEAADRFLAATDLGAVTTTMSQLTERIALLEQRLDGRMATVEATVSDRAQAEQLAAQQIAQLQQTAGANAAQMTELRHRAEVAENRLTQMNLKLPDKVRRRYLED